MAVSNVDSRQKLDGSRWSDIVETKNLKYVNLVKRMLSLKSWLFTKSGFTLIKLFAFLMAYQVHKENRKVLYLGAFCAVLAKMSL